MGVRRRLSRAFAALAAADETPERQRIESTKPLGHGLQEFYPLWLDARNGLSTVDDLVERKGLEIYEEMEERDDMVRASLLLISLGRLSTDWSLTAASDDPKDVEIRDFVDYALRDLDGTSVSRLLFDSLEALKVGFGISNRVMRAPYAQGHPWAGKQGIRTFRPLPQTTITFKTDAGGEIERNGIWQATPRVVVSSTDPDNFDQFARDRFVLYTWLRKSGNPLGKSLLRPAWRWYFMKSQLMPWMGGYLEHYGWPRVWAEAPTDAGQDEKESILEDLRTFQTQQRMVVTKGTKINVEEQRSTTSMDNYKVGIDLANRGIARALLQPATLLDQPEVGAYALGASQKGTFEWFLENLGRTLRDEVMMEQVVRPLVRRNFGENVELPRWDFEPFSEEDKVSISTMFKTLVDAGVAIPAAVVYETLGIRAPEDGEPIIAPPGASPTNQGLPEPPIPTAEDQEEEEERGLDDLVEDIAASRTNEELVEVFKGRGRRSGGRARDLWQR